ncbi:hypothetical protein BO71DRAFT_434783 [Aspergillus ellipticus CBS 707.79]|uniref:Peroxin/Ferlin domain-containing protein n=1 Tax=Aspergillus ellipticus CBS 707.79 TaxID=1448320 RepID=A0A319EEH1_9EURO|nr:hypothetical protein BO71DRAFT_434783 [Aspergillus ellipticus CBS 707.79]
MDPNTANIALIDNTAPRRPSEAALSQITTAGGSSHISRKWTRPSIRNELAKRKYTKWQPDRLGLTDDDVDDSEAAAAAAAAIASSSSRRTSDGRNLSAAETTTTSEGEQPQPPPAQDVNATDFAPEPTSNGGGGNSHSNTDDEHRHHKHPKLTGLKPGTELDILYENQRGWFFFGIPLYSHSSLLNFDPTAWITADGRDSPVNITNAQLPDPSWEWVWKNWYVDMSGDMDDQGWQYSFSFGSSAWHGSHPWFHSFVRRRRWVRLRVKRVVERSRGRTGLEMAHMLNEDYFTIHSGRNKRRAESEAGLSRVNTFGYSVSLSRATTKAGEEEEIPVEEEIADIPALMHALRVAIVDREKVDALHRFMEEGGDELFYLDGQIPEIMSMFVFQASRWQFLTHLTDVVEELGHQVSEVSGKESEMLQRRRDHLQKAVDAARRHLTGPEVLRTDHRGPKIGMLDLTPAPKRGGLLARYSGKVSFKPMDDGGEIKGIPKAAEVGREGHIYQYTSSPRQQRYQLRSCSTFRVSGASLAAHLMLTRGRPCLKRRSLSTVLKTVAAGPGEQPLLFLYPRWFSSGVRHRRSGSSFPAISNIIPKGQGRSHKSKYAPSRGGLDTPYVPETETNVSNVFANTPMLPSASSWDGSRANTEAIIKRLSSRDRRKLRYRLFTKKTQIGMLTNKWTHWGQIRDLLESMEHQNAPIYRRGIKQKEVFAPEATIAMLAGVTDMALEENMWIVPFHHGGKVHVLHARESKGQLRKVIVSGSDVVIDMVCDRIAQARKRQEEWDPLVSIRLPPVPLIPSVEAMNKDNPGEVPLVRAVWEPYAVTHDSTSLRQLQDLGPSLTTVGEVAEHVEDITRSLPLSTYPRRTLEQHPQQVARALVDFFHNDANYSLLSTSALNSALLYLIKHEVLDAARAILLKGQHLMTTQTCNILLRSGALRQNLEFLTSVLRLMYQQNIRPDTDTWLAFLDFLVAPEAKANLAIYMLRRGYLEKASAFNTAVQLTVQYTFQEHLTSGKSVDTFFEKMQASCEYHCFSASLISQMFCVTTLLKNYDAMDRLFEICIQERYPFSEHAVTQILSMYDTNIYVALNYIRQCFRVHPDKIRRGTWERLFLTAFKSARYNICRVLWLYACMYRKVTFAMKDAVMSSLLCNDPGEKDGPFRQAWKSNAGKVIVGINKHLGWHGPNNPPIEGLPEEYRHRPLEYLNLPYDRSDKEVVLVRKKLAHWLVAHDIKSANELKPVEPLMTMLGVASTVDQEWGRHPHSQRWFINNIIRVEVREEEEIIQPEDGVM